MVELLQDTLTDLKSAAASTLVEQMKRIDFTVSQIPADPGFTGLCTDSRINGWMDTMYQDLLIRYQDVHALERTQTVIRGIFNECVMAYLKKTQTITSLASSYITALSSSSLYNKVQRYGFAVSQHTEQLASVCPTSGALTLPARATNWATADRATVTAQLRSTNAEVIYQTEESRIYADDPSTPWYINYRVKGMPGNTIAETDSNTAYPGIICELVIRFAGIYPMNTISMKPFGFGRHDIISLRYTTQPSKSISETNYTWLGDTAYTVTSTANTIDIRLHRGVVAKELIIRIHQCNFITLPVDVTTVQEYTAKTYTTFLRGIYDRLLPDGFRSADLKTQAAEVIADIPKRITVPTSVIDAGDRSYIVGLYNLIVSNTRYDVYGEYYDSVKMFDGYVSKIGASLGGNTVTIRNADIITAHAAVGISFNGVEHSIGTPFMENGHRHIIDGVIVETNTAFHDGFYVADTEHPYRFTTNFRPHVDGDAMLGSLHIDGMRIDMTTNDANIVKLTDNDRTMNFGLSLAFCDQHNIHAGTVLILSYQVADATFNGATYAPDVLSVDDLIGVPSRISPVVTGHRVSTIYTKVPALSAAWAAASVYAVGSYVTHAGITYRCRIAHTAAAAFETDDAAHYWVNSGAYKYYAYADTEYLSALWNDTDVVQFPISKEPLNMGVTTAVGQVTIGSSTNFVYLTDIVGPFDDIYWGVIREPVTDANYAASVDLGDGFIYRRYATETDYMLGSLSLVNRTTGQIISADGFRQYAQDTDLDYVTDKSVFYVRQDLVTIADFNDYELYYIPINREFTSLYTGSTIANHNQSERFAADATATLTLTTPAHIDWTIINADAFMSIGGSFSLRNHFSVTYEPIIIYVDGVKITDTTDYKAGVGVFTPNLQAIEFYYDGISKIYFNKPVTGDIIVYSYASYNSLTPFVKLYRSDYTGDDITPVIPDYTLFVMAQR